MGRRQKTPGPGTYNPDVGQVRRAAPAYSIATKVTNSATDPSPGPGTYGPSGGSGSGVGPSYTIAGRRMESRTLPTPGPGAYHTARSAHGIAYTIAGRCGNSARDPSPGPGSYNIGADSSAPAYSIPRRFPSPLRGQATPGPAAYGVDDKVIHTAAPVFSIGARHSSAYGQMSPGPGTYDPRLKSGAPAYTMGSTPRFDDD